MNRKQLAVFLALLGIVVVLGLFAGALCNPTSSTAREQQTRASAANLRNAIKQYYVEYSRFPLKQSEQGADTPAKQPIESNQELMDTLLGIDETTNPRRIPFGEWKDAGDKKTNGIVFGNGSESSGVLLDGGDESSGPLVDSWGMPYHILLDGDYDNILKSPDPSETQALRDTILVFSTGPDRKIDTWEDNVKTW